MKAENRPTLTPIETFYVCEEPDCAFETRSETDAATHTWYEHKQEVIESLHFCVEPKSPIRDDPYRPFHQNITLRKLASKEDFDLFCTVHKIDPANTMWEGPGWYERWIEEAIVDNKAYSTEYVQPARKTVHWLERLKRESTHALSVLRDRGIRAPKDKPRPPRTLDTTDTYEHEDDED